MKHKKIDYYHLVLKIKHQTIKNNQNKMLAIMTAIESEIESKNEQNNAKHQIEFAKLKQQIETLTKQVETLTAKSNFNGKFCIEIGFNENVPTILNAACVQGKPESAEIIANQKKEKLREKNNERTAEKRCKCDKCPGWTSITPSVAKRHNESDIHKNSVAKKGEEVETPEKEVSTNVSKGGSRDMTKCFNDGQTISHTIDGNKTWIGIYDSSKNGIICDTKLYKSLSGFAAAHYSKDRPDRLNSANGWKECKCEVNGKWISTFNL